MTSSEYATGQESAATSGSVPEPAAEEENAVAEGDSSDLRRESASLLARLADRYDSEAEESRANAVRLRAESEAEEAKANKLGEESSRIRNEAERLEADPLSAPPAASEPAKEEPTTAPATPSDVTTVTPSGPSPARGFASGSEDPAPSGSSGSGTVTGSSQPEDWAPRPFESWRNQATQVPPRNLDL
jgi:hypothetical protein